MSSKTAGTSGETTRNTVTRGDVIAFVKAIYAAERRIPSIREVMRRFHLNSGGFYALFQNLEDLCHASGFNVPAKRMRVTSAARKAQRKVGDDEVEREKRIIGKLNAGLPILTIAQEEGHLDEIRDIVEKLAPFLDEREECLDLIDRYCQDKFPSLHRQVAEAVNANEGEGGGIAPLYGSILFLIARIERGLNSTGKRGAKCMS